MTTARNALLRALAGALLLAGCASAPSRFYSLQATAGPDGAPALRGAVLVGPVSVPASVDRPEFVVQQGPNRVEVEEFNRWDGPLGDGIARVVAGDLAVLLGTPDVAVAPLANFRTDYRVSLDVQRFQSTPAREVLLDAVWVVHAVKDGRTQSGRSVAQEPVDGPEFAALAAAHSRALARLSADLAAAIRAAAAAH
ncbi:MAG: PqiC family protein [Deltaproteobacteria bacterium]|nr:PqiC family protein [Deltaproteobacteria bacterium]